MGLYNYLGAYQVKCFYLANVIVDSLDNLSLYTIGGTLRQFEVGDEVPYKTLYYNYGKDFLIFDTRGISLDDPVVIHIIKDGKFFDTVEYSRLSEDYFVPNVIDVYGEKLNIQKYEEILDYYNAVCKREKDYRELTEKYDKEFNVNKSFYQDYRAKVIEKEEFYEELEKAKKVSDRVHNEVNVPFNKRWRFDDFICNDIGDGVIIGHLLDCYINLDKTVYEWNCIFDKFLEFIKKEGYKYETLVDSYRIWCKNNDISVIEDSLKEMTLRILKRGDNIE